MKAPIITLPLNSVVSIEVCLQSGDGTLDVIEKYRDQQADPAQCSPERRGLP